MQSTRLREKGDVAMIRSIETATFAVAPSATQAMAQRATTLAGRALAFKAPNWGWESPATLWGLGQEHCPMVHRMRLTGPARSFQLNQ